MEEKRYEWRGTWIYSSSTEAIRQVIAANNHMGIDWQVWILERCLLVNLNDIATRLGPNFLDW